MAATTKAQPAALAHALGYGAAPGRFATATEAEMRCLIDHYSGRDWTSARAYYRGVIQWLRENNKE